MKKRISIDDLKLGMRVVGLDQTWWQSPLWVHRHLIKSEGDIAHLRRSGVREVDIDEVGVCTETGVASGSGMASEPHQEIKRDRHLSCEEGSSEDNHPTIPEDSAPGSPARSAAEQFDEKLEAAREIRLDAIAAVEKVFEGIKTGVELQSNGLVEVTETLLASLIDHESSMLAEIQLQRLKKFNASLFAHSVDVCVMSLLVGRRSQLSDDQLHILALGSLLHDVGQVRLPRNLLTKNGSFTPGERRLFESHPHLGATIIAEGEGLPSGVGAS